MRKTTRKSATSIRAFVDRINSDPEERIRFLLDPSESLSKLGIVLSTKAKNELQILIREFLETYPEIALLTTHLPRIGGRGAKEHGKRGTDRAPVGLFIA